VEPEGFVDTVRSTSGEILARFDPETVNLRLRGLIARDVIEAHPTSTTSVRIKVPLFKEWLNGKGASRILETLPETAYVPISTTPDIPDLEVVGVCRDVVYRGRQIHPEDVRMFLTQFGRPVDQKLILKLLQRIHDYGYWPERRMRDAVRTMYESMESRCQGIWFIKTNHGSRPRVDNLFVTCTGKPGKSGPNIVRMMQSEIADLFRPNIDDMRKVIEKARGFANNRENKGQTAIICIVDDFIGSGLSAVDDLKSALSEIGIGFRDWRSKAFIFYGVLTGFDSGIARIENEVDPNVHVYCSHVLTDADRAFHSDAGIFTDEHERQAAYDLCRAAGQTLARDFPLGYGGGQALVVFNSSVPNNTLPIFWAQGKHWRGGGMWKPLFSRHALEAEREVFY
jgi:hypothetical protein